MSEAKQNEIKHNLRQMGKTQMCIDRAYNMVMQAADPVAAERAKRYIWSRIERNDTSRRAGKR